MIKRKGQIVPRWLVKSKEKKAQHVVKFRCDVSICRGSRTIKVLSNEGSIFNIPYVTHVLKNKNKRIVKGFIISDITVVGNAEFNGCSVNVGG